MIALLLALAAGVRPGVSPRVSLRVDPGHSSEFLIDAAGQLGLLEDQHRAGSLAHTRSDEVVSSGPNASLVERLRYSVIRLQAQVSDRNLLRPWITVSKEGTFVGSGFVVRNRKDQGPLIVTNAHVVSNANRVTIQVPASGQTSYEARVVLINPDMDIALVELANMKQVETLVANVGFELNPVPIYRKAAKLGEEVMTMGFPLGQTTVKLTKGVIAGHEMVGQFMAFQQTAPISPGNSGGPLFNPGTGEVVGINFAAAVGENSQSNNYAIPGWHVDQMLHEYDRSKMQEHTTAPSSTYNQIACRESHTNCVYHVPKIHSVAAEGTPALYDRYDCKEGFFISRVDKDSIFAAAEPPVVGRSFVISVNGITLDKFGMAKSDLYFDDPILFTNLLFMSRAMGPAEVEVCTCGETKIHKVPISALAHTIHPPKDEAIPSYDEPSLVKFDYEQFGDVTIQPLNSNLLQLLATTGSKRTDLLRFAAPEQNATVLVVTDVLRVNKNTGALAVGDVIEKINGHPVKDLAELRKFFVPKHKKAAVPSLAEIPGQCKAHEMLWTLETSTGKEIAQDWHKALSAQRDSVQRGERPLTPAVRSALRASQTLSMVEESLKQPAMPELSVVEQAVEERTDVRRGGAPLYDLKSITAGMKFF